MTMLPRSGLVQPGLNEKAKTASLALEAVCTTYNVSSDRARHPSRQSRRRYLELIRLPAYLDTRGAGHHWILITSSHKDGVRPGRHFRLFFSALFATFCEVFFLCD